MYDTLLLSHGQRLVAGKFPRFNAHTVRDRIRLLYCTPYRHVFTPISPRCALLREHSPPFRILSSMFLPYPSQKVTLGRADWGIPFVLWTFIQVATRKTEFFDSLRFKKNQY